MSKCELLRKVVANVLRTVVFLFFLVVLTTGSHTLAQASPPSQGGIFIADDLDVQAVRVNIPSRSFVRLQICGTDRIVALRLDAQYKFKEGRYYHLRDAVIEVRIGELSLGNVDTIEFWEIPSCPSVQLVPKSVDLTDDKLPVGNQRAQGSCTAWAVAYYYKSYQEKKKRGWEYNDAHLFSPSYIYNQYATSNKWGPSSVEYAFQVLASEGVAPLSVSPYNQFDWSTQPSQEARAIAANYKIAAYQKLCAPCGGDSIEVLRRHLASGDPFVMSIPIYLRGIQIAGWDPIIIDDVPTIIDYGNAFSIAPLVQVKDYQHAVAVVGYDDSAQRFKFVNSWGPDKGDKGYYYITYGTIIEFGAIEAFAMTDTTEACPRKPQGDANCDGVINLIDFEIWRRSQCRPGPGQTCADLSADFNQDGNVDDADYQIWNNGYKNSQ